MCASDAQHPFELTGPREIARDLWWVPTSISNVFLWKDGHGRGHIFDTGMPGDHRTILNAATAVGVPIDDSSTIVLSHWHRDHSGGAADLAAATGATVWAGTADAQVLAGRAEPQYPDLTDSERPIFEGILATKPDAMRPPQCPGIQALDEGTFTGADSGVVVLGVAGHTAGSIAIHLTDIDAVLTGDVVINDPDSGLRPGPFNADNVRAAAQFDRIRALGTATLAVGHGTPVHPGIA